MHAYNIILFIRKSPKFKRHQISVPTNCVHATVELEKIHKTLSKFHVFTDL